MLSEIFKLDNLVIESGGRDRIRTYGGLPHTYFPSKHLKPLRHSSENELYKTNTERGSRFYIYFRLLPYIQHIKY